MDPHAHSLKAVESGSQSKGVSHDSKSLFTVERPLAAMPLIGCCQILKYCGPMVKRKGLSGRDRCR
jgi:hypothetical protein